MNKIKYTVAYLCIAMLTYSVSNAQFNASPASLEVMKMRSLWMNSDNSAGLLLDNPLRYAEVNGSFSATSGDFHRPQQGEKVNDIAFGTEGGVMLNNMYTWGEFSYIRRSIANANYNASIIDPYRGMPYMVADANPSDWNHQLIDLRFRVSNPISKKLALGVDGVYNVASGAKMRDIRSTSYVLELGIKPGIAYAISSKHAVGFNLAYTCLKEEQSSSTVNTEITQQYFELYGLGTAIQKIGSGRSTHYEGNSIGAAMQYSYSGNISLLFNSSYAMKVEDAAVSYENPRSIGTVKDYVWENKLQLYSQGEHAGSYLALQYLSRNIDGIEYINENDNSQGKSRWVTLYKSVRSNFNTKSFTADYDFLIGSKSEYRWKLGAGAYYVKQQDEYILPFSEKNYENITYQLRANKNFLINEALTSRFLLATDYSYNNNLSGKYAYGGNNYDNVIVKDFEPSDLKYLMSNFHSFGVSGTYSQKISKKNNANLFLKLSWRFTNVEGVDFSNRKIYLVSFGCNF